MATYPITGIKKGLGPGEAVPVRREVDEWWFSKDKNDLYQRSLFIYALNDFMKMKPDDQLSYFSIAGIHGQPLNSWDTKVPEQGSWYCTHGTPLFPPWHRPYILLYEQRLYEIMLKLIPLTFAKEDQADMIHAAETWRFPFWDWAMKKPDWHFPNDRRRDGPNVPFIITTPTVEVKTKTGVAQVANPMWQFKLPADPRRITFGDYGITQDEELPFNRCKATNRHASTFSRGDPDYVSAWVNGENPNWDAITGELRGARGVESNTLPESVYRLFLEEYLPTYNAFATDGYRKGQSAPRYSSLEDIHGQLHVFTGGSGFMSRVSVAAFDPIFWMHHCNVDRIFAMWQDLYPNKYVETFRAGRGVIRPDVPLAPFHKDTAGTPWDAMACRYQQQLGYTYPELQKWKDEYKTNGAFDAKKYQKALRTTIELKYSTTGKSTLQLPENNNVATLHLATIPSSNLAVENFPPALVARAEKLKASTPKDIPVITRAVQAPLVDDTSSSSIEIASAPAVAKAAPAPQTIPQEKWQENDYIVNVLYDRFAHNGYPYIIRIFLGDVPTGSLAFAETPTQVGLVYNFSAPADYRGLTPAGCANCIRQQEEHEMSTGQVILTDYLVERITKHVEERGLTLQSLSKEDVTTYLKANLHWRISDINDVLIPKEDMPSLKVSVAMGKATHFLAAEIPSKYEDYEVLYEVTDGRLAGANPGDLD